MENINEKKENTEAVVYICRLSFTSTAGKLYKAGDEILNSEYVNKLLHMEKIYFDKKSLNLKK
jgi:hypothetical protein